MHTTRFLGILLASAALAACGGGGGGGTSAGVLDAFPPFGASTGVAVPALSSDLGGGVSSIQTEVIFNADQTFTIILPGGGSITSGDADIDATFFDPFLNVTVTFYTTPDSDFIDVLLGEDAAGNDLFVLARIDEGTSPAGFETYGVIGDETAALPTGSATYTGAYIASIFTSTGTRLDDLVFGTSEIIANFDTTAVDLTLTEVDDAGTPTGDVLVGTGSIVSGAQYDGTISSTVGSFSDYAGEFNGAFYGPGADATAGTFNADDVAGNTEILGGFTGFK